MEDAVAANRQDEPTGQAGVKVIVTRPQTVWSARNYALIGAIPLIISDVVVAVLGAVGALARRAQARYRLHRHAAATREALSELDDHTLRDLGFHRSEIDSITAGLVGGSGRDRIRVYRNR
jgi:uncharacterized protein YjiS (DUF1127 family)